MYNVYMLDRDGSMWCSFEMALYTKQRLEAWLFEQFDLCGEWPDTVVVATPAGDNAKLWRFKVECSIANNTLKLIEA